MAVLFLLIFSFYTIFIYKGLRNTSAGTVDYTDGADARPLSRAISDEVRSLQIFCWVVHI